MNKKKGDIKRDEIQALIQFKKLTLVEMADVLDISSKTLSYYLKNFVASEQIHVSGWLEQESNSRFTWVKIYSYGAGSGDIPEKPLTPKSVSAKRTYERNKSGISVYEKAELSEAKIFARKPVNFVPVKQSWFSALGTA